MAVPSVFVSSTWYDLRYIRENLRYLISTLGYSPILSEDGTVYYDPTKHVHQACVAEIPNCQLFVLIIGGRYGSQMIGSGKSVTNAEYEEAARLRIPVFALVEASVLSDHAVYEANKHDTDLIKRMAFPSVDDIAIFGFIDEVRSNSVNNALVPFRDFNDIESYLRLQWAGMMHAFLTRNNEDARVNDTLSLLTDMNQRIELLSRQILRSVGDNHAELALQLYDLMLTSQAVRDLSYWGVRPSPRSILVNGTFKKCANDLGIELRVDDEREGEIAIGAKGYLTREKFKIASQDYKDIHTKLRQRVKESGMSIEDFVRESA